MVDFVFRNDEFVISSFCRVRDKKRQENLGLLVFLVKTKIVWCLLTFWLTLYAILS